MSKVISDVDICVEASIHVANGIPMAKSLVKSLQKAREDQKRDPSIKLEVSQSLLLEIAKHSLKRK